MISNSIVTHSIKENMEEISENNIKDLIDEDFDDIHLIVNSDNKKYYQKTSDIFDLGFDFGQDNYPVRNSTEQKNIHPKNTMTEKQEKELFDYIINANLLEVYEYILTKDDLKIDFEDISKESFFNDVMQKFLKFFLSKSYDKKNLISWIKLCNDNNINLDQIDLPTIICKSVSRKRKNDSVIDNLSSYETTQKRKIV